MYPGTQFRVVTSATAEYKRHHPRETVCVQSYHTTWTGAMTACLAFMHWNNRPAWVACPEHNDDGSYLNR